MKILVVDDELVARKKAEKILSQYGECHTAANGMRAIEGFELAHKEGEPYDFITMDILMPDMSGIEVLEKIREWEGSHDIKLGKGVKILMLTATKSKDTVIPSFSKGCEAYIVKPFNKEKLVNALNKLGFASNGN